MALHLAKGRVDISVFGESGGPFGSDSNSGGWNGGVSVPHRKSDLVGGDLSGTAGGFAADDLCESAAGEVRQSGHLSHGLDEHVAAGGGVAGGDHFGND